jgi:CubicO group peptidase (beta-lactamase class C family)
MSIASASKWLYAAYVIQKVGVRAQDIPFLNFTSGYSLFLLPLCRVTDTVESCLLAGNDRQNPNTIGKFFYDSGHMQQHAVSAMGLGPLRNGPLGDALRATLGDFGMLYTQPQLAGGVVATAAGYAQFLRRVLRGELAIANALGAHKVCTNPRTCATAVAAPIPDSESWNYSLGHWVEDDPLVGDHAFSSAGALGFYPWINSAKTLYGVLARRADDVAGEGNAGYNSAACGRLIRQAWVSGIAVTRPTPTP